MADTPAQAGPRKPPVLVVMGVSGSGKSTIGSRLARRLGWPFADGDDFHTPEHVAKMHSGRALDDADRAPWLALLRGWIDARIEAGEGGVIVCSALKRTYRDSLRGGREQVRIVYLKGSREMIARRLARRRGHFMPAGLLDSQFAVLEVPGADETPIMVDIEDGPNDIVATIEAQIGSSDG